MLAERLPNRQYGRGDKAEKETAMKTGQIFRAACGIVLLAMVFSIAKSAQSSGGDITGAVKSSTGRLFNSVWVIISQDGIERGRSLTGDDGKYYISNLNEGTYDVLVLKGNRQIYKGQVNLPGDSRYDIPIKPRR
jgi:hypothetical protein